MKAGRIHSFGPPNAIVIDEMSCPTPEEGELVVRVAAAGVGSWDALIREGKSVVQVSLPIILGSDLAGIVDSVGAGVAPFKPGDEVLLRCLCRICGGVSPASKIGESTPLGLPISTMFAASEPRLFGPPAQYLRSAMHRKHDLSSLVWRASQHFVRLPSLLERKHGAHLRDPSINFL
jgi:hypothetical protein